CWLIETGSLSRSRKQVTAAAGPASPTSSASPGPAHGNATPPARSLSQTPTNTTTPIDQQQAVTPACFNQHQHQSPQVSPFGELTQRTSVKTSRGRTTGFEPATLRS